MVGSPSWMTLRGGRPFWMSGWGRVALPELGKALRKFRRPARRSGIGLDILPDDPEWWEALPDVREWSEGPPRCPRVAGRPSRIFGSGREALMDV